jgi:purine-binding chemotaxis protein CheW
MQMTTGQTAGSGDLSHLVGFTVDNEEYCVDILKVQEIIRMVGITKMPNAPGFVEGVINLRGKVIPVIDFRKRFNLGGSADVSGNNRRIVVVIIDGVTIGFIVDQVSQVFKLNPEQIAPAPETVRNRDSDCISGVGMLNDKLLILLDLEKMLNQGELEKVGQAA